MINQYRFLSIDRSDIAAAELADRRTAEALRRYMQTNGTTVDPLPYCSQVEDVPPIAEPITGIELACITIAALCVMYALASVRWIGAGLLP